MDKKLNPLDGEIDLLGDTVSDIIRKLNPLTGRLELVYSADSYIQKINPFIGDFDMVGGTGANYITKTLTGNGYVDLTNAVANHLLHVKLFGKCVQNGTPTPTTQESITCNNGEIKYGNTGNNLYDPNDILITIGRYINASNGAVLESATNFLIEKYFEVEPGESYVYYGRNKSTNSMSSYNRIAFYDSNKTFLSTGTYTKDKIGTGTAPSNAKYARLSNNPSGESAQGGTPVDLEYIHGYNRTFKKGTAETEFDGYSIQRYVDGTVETVEDELGNEATAERLLSVGDTTDTQEILHGNITRKIGIKVLDGTENRQLATGTGFRQFYSSDTQGIIANGVSLMSTIAPYGCTASTRTQYQFGCYSGNSGNLCFQMIGSQTLTTVQERTTRLMEQYINGTPVIVVYPLATQATEHVQGQTMSIVDGANRIEIVDASIQNLPLEVQYKATA